MFMDLENNDFRIAAGFPGIGAATNIPAHIADVTDLKVNEDNFPGAFGP